MNNIYLIVGNSKKRINDKVNEIIGNNNKIIYNFDNSEIEDIITEASYYSMFNEIKYILVKNSHLFKLKEEDVNVLIKYLNSPNKNTVIIFISEDKIDNRKKITKILKDKYEIVEIKDIYKKDLLVIANDYVKKNKYSIDNRSLNYILDNNLNNYDLVINELDKIFIYYSKPCFIEYEDVISITSRVIDDNSFKFIEAMVNKDLKASFKVYDDLMINKVDPFSLIMLLAREYRLMYKVKYYYDETHNIYEVVNKMKMLDWQVKKLLTNSGKYSYSELKNNLAILAKLDLDFKSGRVDRFLGLQQFILDYLS